MDWNSDLTSLSSLQNLTSWVPIYSKNSPQRARPGLMTLYRSTKVLSFFLWEEEHGRLLSVCLILLTTETPSLTVSQSLELFIESDRIGGGAGITLINESPVVMTQIFPSNPYKLEVCWALLNPISHGVFFPWLPRGGGRFCPPLWEARTGQF